MKCGILITLVLALIYYSDIGNAADEAATIHKMMAKRTETINKRWQEVDNIEKNLAIQQQVFPCDSAELQQKFHDDYISPPFTEIENYANATKPGNEKAYECVATAAKELRNMFEIFFQNLQDEIRPHQHAMRKSIKGNTNIDSERKSLFKKFTKSMNCAEYYNKKIKTIDKNYNYMVRKFKRRNSAVSKIHRNSEENVKMTALQFLDDVPTQVNNIKAEAKKCIDEVQM